MKLHLFVLPLLALALPVSISSAQPVYKSPTPADYQAPAADLEKWAARLKMLCPEKGWTVKVENNDVLIEFDKPVRFENNALQQTSTYEGPFRLRLSFGPLLTQDDYEKLEAKNDETFLKKYALMRKYQVRLMKTLDAPDFSVYSNLEGGGAAYIKESSQLTFYNYPDFYAPNYSLYLSPANSQFYSLATTEPAFNECKQVERDIRDQFGKYFKKEKMYILPSVPLRYDRGAIGLPNWPETPPIVVMKRNRTPRVSETLKP